MLNVALVGDFVQHDGLAVANAEFLNLLDALVNVYALDRAMRDPRARKIVHGQAVVDGAQMVIRVAGADHLRDALPVGQLLVREDVVFVGQ